MFDSILIANRGEIACRVIRTCRRLGIRSIALYSDADAAAMHVAEADEALHIGPAPARESYLRVEALIEAARRSGAQAVHPGYGFLSENAGFAEACAEAGLVFIGPPPAAIRAMGSKSAAKRIMEEAGVPLVPGYHGDDQDPETLAGEAEKVGFPLLIKASAGGGGKGMRIVEKAADFQRALEGAQREAKAGFGDDTVLLERYLTRPRHVEMQVFADNHGNAIHLFERDCSIQRRHQKVVEEAPAPGMTEAMRAAMGEAATTAAKAIGYSGAGTVEFIVDSDRMGHAEESFFFMEMNTRLQVEHPVTEMITGQDLVEWQIRVAAGEPLPLAQEDVSCDGHAIEVRLYAEDPARDFLPQTGRLAHLRLPSETPHVRVDTGVRSGDSVTMFYDPMIAKLVVWDRDRRAAIRRLRLALGETETVGVQTNRDFLIAIAAHPAFAEAALDTGFIARHRDDLVPERGPAGTQQLALAALGVLCARERAQAIRASASSDPHSPWDRIDGWCLNGRSSAALRLRDGDREVPIRVGYPTGGEGFVLGIEDGEVAAAGDLSAEGFLSAAVDGIRRAATVVFHGDDLHVITRGHSHVFGLVDPLAGAGGAESAVGKLTAPMPGRVVAVNVKPGEKVKRGQALMVLEAMKMEHTIAAPGDGVVATVNFNEGDQANEGDALLAFEEA